MAFAATKVDALDRAWSIGPVKVEVQTFTAADGDTSGTVTANHLSRVDLAIVTGLLDVAQTISGAEVSLTFDDPAADAEGQILLIGR